MPIARRVAAVAARLRAGRGRGRLRALGGGRRRPGRGPRRPVRLDHGVLLVEVDEPAWATQVAFSRRPAPPAGEVTASQVDRVDVRVGRPRRTLNSRPTGRDHGSSRSTASPASVDGDRSPRRRSRCSRGPGGVLGGVDGRDRWRGRQWQADVRRTIAVVASISNGVATAAQGLRHGTHQVGRPARRQAPASAARRVPAVHAAGRRGDVVRQGARRRRRAGVEHVSLGSAGQTVRGDRPTQSGRRSGVEAPSVAVIERSDVAMGTTSSGVATRSPAAPAYRGRDTALGRLYVIADTAAIAAARPDGRGHAADRVTPAGRRSFAPSCPHRPPVE